ncbi:MAG TPA: diacylglycerol kinase family protein [Flavitalea sp.]|nr:diacylglycerol kinase family protein [Flavitalea sp.]
MTTRMVALLANTKAGKGKSVSICNQIIARLREDRILFEEHRNEWPVDLKPYTDVFLIGGDGTLNYFINRYPEVRIPVSVFRGGSGNDFVWKLLGQRSFAECYDIAIHGEAKPIDAGRCNGRYFINGVGIGFDGKVVRSMGQKKIISAGHIAYYITVLKEILFYREPIVHFKNGPEEETKKVFMISIANGSRYGGGFMVAPQAVLNDGLLDLVYIDEIGLWGRLKYLPVVEKGKHLQLSFIHWRRLKKIIISSPVLLPAHLDGEFMESTEFDIEILPARFLFRTDT